MLIVNAATTIDPRSRALYGAVRLHHRTGSGAVRHLGGSSTATRSVYAIYTDYGPGLEAGRVFKKTFTEAGGKIVGEVKPPFTTPDYSPYLQRAKDAHPQAIFIFAPAAGHPVAFLKAYSDAGLNAQTGAGAGDRRSH